MGSIIISFIIAVYNNEKYITTAVKSVTDQIIGRDDLEIIIVDDGSTDNTSVIADELAGKDKRIKVIHQKNQWIYASFNNGINAAQGEYIYILNSDDKLENNAVQKLLESIDKYNHPDVIWTKIIWRDVDQEQNVISEYDVNPGIKANLYYDSKDYVMDNWLSVIETGVAVNQANLYKRELALRHPFRNDYYAGDSFFNIGIANDINSMLFLSEPVYIYMAYNNPELNASIGKNYGYEHKMFNELMQEKLSLYKKWDKIGLLIDSVVQKRLKEITYEIEILGYKNCKIPNEKKVLFVFGEIADGEVRKLAAKVGKEREYESRILTGTRRMINELGLKDYVPGFVNDLIKYLPENHLDNVDKNLVDFKIINNAILDKDNLDEIGKVYYYQDW